MGLVQERSEMRFLALASDNVDPYSNLAMEQYLFRFAEEDMAVLFLWQNDDTVMIGRNQNAFDQCRVESFLDQGGHIARRRSGGGAVYHDLGNLNFSIISLLPVTEETSYRNIVVRTVQKLGIEASFSGRNDVLCQDRKISGSAVYSDGKHVCQHGTVLVNSDIGRMERFLTPEGEKLDRHGVKSVSARVANLTWFDRSITVDKVRKSFIEAVGAETFDITPDQEELKKLTEFYKSEDWIFGGKA